MAGRRLLDLAALFNASRGVAQKHVAIRSQQLEFWGQTSSVAKAVKDQKDRTTETVEAASFLALRLNESAPAWTREASCSADEMPSISRGRTGPKAKEGQDLDQLYERFESNTLSYPVLAEDPEFQRNADAYPPSNSSIKDPTRDQDVISGRLSSLLKDPMKNRYNEEDELWPIPSRKSTIPIPPDDAMVSSSNPAKKPRRQFEQQMPSQSADAEEIRSQNRLSQGHNEDGFYTRSKLSSPVLSPIPRLKILKQRENTHSGDGGVQYDMINSDSYSASPPGESSMPAAQAKPEQVEGVNIDLFSSPRVANLLGGRTQALRKADLKLKAVDKAHLGLTTDPSGVNLESLSSQGLTNDAVSKSREDNDVAQLVGDVPSAVSIEPNISSSLTTSASPYEMRESKVPSSRIGRLWNYGGLAAGMIGGAISESLRRAAGSGGEGSYMLSAGNMDRLVARLSRMRGAALKLGQMMSFQDSKMLPAPIQQVLLRVQDSADYMPPSQRNKVLASNLGQDWREMFLEFEEKPMAAASIGQVHRATLKSTRQRVAVKVQYPGVADSIDSDLSNLAVLLIASQLLPKGLYLEKTIANARTELAWECDYVREAECGQRFQALLSDEKNIFVVPKVYPEASGKEVLTMEYMNGVGVTKLQNFTQMQKDWVGTQVLRLCLREIMEFKFMQTDPNWTNFLYNAETNKIELLDFGASREYPEEFVSRYTSLLLAASRSDKDTVRGLSVELGYLTGHESKMMLKAHISSILTLAEPFLASSPEVYDFQNQTITERVKALIPVMVQERLAPPPEETYSLHRKLSGAFLLCARLGSRVRCRELFENSMRRAEILT